MMTGPCEPAAAPVICLVTVSEPGARKMAWALTVVVRVSCFETMSFWAALSPGSCPS